MNTKASLKRIDVIISYDCVVAVLLTHLTPYCGHGSGKSNARRELRWNIEADRPVAPKPFAPDNERTSGEVALSHEQGSRGGHARREFSFCDRNKRGIHSIVNRSSTTLYLLLALVFFSMVAKKGEEYHSYEYRYL